MKSQNFKTSEFNLVAFCICNGAVITSIDKTQRRAVFEISLGQPAKELIDAYWSDTPVPVNRFVSAQNEVKKRLYSDSF